MTTRRLLPLAGIALAAACAHKPPADFAPDPGLVARIRQIRIRAPQVACPGQSFAVYYDAILDDGTRIQFDGHYDRNHPPRLHVSFLDRESWTARALDDGGWTASPDPVQTVRTGFVLTATLKAKPSLADTAVVTPDYSCLPHALRFAGVNGRRGSAGGDGPAVSVRVGIVRSPFYDKLLVAAITIENQPPVYVLTDATSIPPANWLTLDSKGGNGGEGRPGQAGADGVAGQDGCPGSAGGSGGKGGAGGKGSATSGGGHCADGPGGQSGSDGAAGRDGPDGGWGPQPQILTVPLHDLFGPGAPPELLALVSGN